MNKYSSVSVIPLISVSLRSDPTKAETALCGLTEMREKYTGKNEKIPAVIRTAGTIQP